MVGREIEAKVCAMDGVGRMHIVLSVSEKDRAWILRKMREKYAKTGNDDLTATVKIEFAAERVEPKTTDETVAERVA